MNLFIKINLLNSFLKFLMILLSCSILFTENVFMKWMLLESFSLIFIGFMNLNNLNKIPSLIYFFISSISSLMIFLNMIYLMNYLYLKDNFEMNSMLMLSMMLKLGIFPFNLWMIYSFPMMSWMEIFFFSTFNKIIPLNLFNSFIYMNNYLLMFIILNMLISSIFALNEYSVKKIMAFSSMNHSSFFILMSTMNSNSFLIYFIIYLLSSYLMIYLLKIMNLNNKFSFMNLKMLKKNNFLSSLIIFSYSMLPPFNMFMMKWFFFFENINILESIFFFILMMISSVIMTWNYLNLMNYQFIFMKLTKKNWMKNYNLNMKMMFMLILSMSMFFFNFYLLI